MTQQFELDDFIKRIKNKPDDDNSNKSNNSASNRSALSNNPGLYFENRVSSKPSDKANKEEKISAQMQKRINDFFKSDDPSEPQQVKNISKISIIIIFNHYFSMKIISFLESKRTP